MGRVFERYSDTHSIVRDQMSSPTRLVWKSQSDRGLHHVECPRPSTLHGAALCIRELNVAHPGMQEALVTGSTTWSMICSQLQC